MSFLGKLFLLLLGLWGKLAESQKAPKKAEGAPEVALLAIKEPDALAGSIPGLFAAFTGDAPSADQEFEIRVPPVDDPVGCSPYQMDPVPASKRSPLVLVRRGNCTFVEKALKAQKAGAAGLLVMFDSDKVFPMSGANDTSQEKQVQIFAVSIGKKYGTKIWDQTAGTKSGSGVKPAPVVLSISVYTSSLLNLSELVLILLATALVAAGAFFSTSDMRQSSFSTAIAPPTEEVLEVDSWMAGGFCIMGSGMLVFLFFFMDYMIYVIMFAFCLGGGSCITQFGSLVLHHFAPKTKTRVADVPFFGPVTQAELICGVPAFFIVVAWFTLRNTDYGWFFQDIIGAGFLCWMQRTLRLPNMKIASILLSAMFFFDIFWVFLSPMIFKKSVMIEVATGGGTGQSVPMVLKIPALSSDLPGQFKILGLGDIAIPGLLISLLLRHDLVRGYKRCGGYFLAGVIGYAVGLLATFVSLYLMQHGQPALLFLVPGTLVPTCVIALRKGELAALWAASYGPEAPEGYVPLAGDAEKQA
mmetsp:Transcript_41014/g.73787  ORF Transcript_41014/g.73787 Transcript_41014/m.73787 type:complete len:527 (+) Transcript_41014:89-1669(+)